MPELRREPSLDDADDPLYKQVSPFYDAAGVPAGRCT
jgi:hypothetical protein